MNPTPNPTYALRLQFKSGQDILVYTRPATLEDTNDLHETLFQDVLDNTDWTVLETYAGTLAIDLRELEAFLVEPLDRHA